MDTSWLAFMRQFFVMKTLAIDTIAALVAFMGNATRKVLFLFYFLWPEEEPWKAMPLSKSQTSLQQTLPM